MGANVTFTACDAPAAIVPLVKLAAYAALILVPTLSEVTVSGAVPLFVIVSVALAFPPTGTLPNARMPLKEMTRVPAGVEGADGADGELLPLPPLHATDAITHATTHKRLNNDMGTPRESFVRFLVPRLGVSRTREGASLSQRGR